MKYNFLIICFILIGQHLFAQNNTRELYKIAMEKYLRQENKTGSHSLVVFGDVDTSWLPQNIGKIKIQVADSSFFNGLKDTTFEYVKLLPIEIVDGKIVAGISRFQYRLEGLRSEIIFSTSYYFVFKYNCATKKIVFDKYKNESI